MCVFVNTLTSVQVGSNLVKSFVIPSCDTSCDIRIVQFLRRIFIVEVHSLGFIFIYFNRSIFLSILRDCVCVHTRGSLSSVDC